VTAPRFANTVILFAIGYLGFLLYIWMSKTIALFYYPPLIILLVALAAALKIPTRFRVSLALVLLSAGLTVLLCETILQATAISQERAHRKEKAQQKTVAYGIRDDFRSSTEVVRDLRAGGVQAYPYAFIGDLGSTGFELNGTDVFPLAGISRTTTVLCNEVGEPVVYESDEHGFNNPSGVWGRDNIDIVLLGDSFIHRPVCPIGAKRCVANKVLVSKHSQPRVGGYRALRPICGHERVRGTVETEGRYLVLL
jgi:hypothetical protein